MRTPKVEGFATGAGAVELERYVAPTVVPAFLYRNPDARGDPVWVSDLAYLNEGCRMWESIETCSLHQVRHRA